MKIPAITGGIVVAFTAVVLILPAGASAPAGRYTIGNGTVYDTKTRLTWQQMADTAVYGQPAAEEYCANLSLNGGTWRLPTIKELQTLCDYGQPASPTIDAAAFPGSPLAPFWSSTPLVGSTDSAWYFDFGLGLTQEIETTQTYHVRCMLSSTAP